MIERNNLKETIKKTTWTFLSIWAVLVIFTSLFLGGGFLGFLVISSIALVAFLIGISIDCILFFIKKKVKDKS